MPLLEQWADRLAQISWSTHRVPASRIRFLMTNWKHDLTVEEVLSYAPNGTGVAASTADGPRAADRVKESDDAEALVFDDERGEFV